MRLFQFIKWWWDQNDIFNRTIVIGILYSVLGILPAAILFGEIGAQIMLVIGISALLLFCLLFFLISYLADTWKVFNLEMPTEDVQIMNKLKGVKRVRKIRAEE